MNTSERKARESVIQFASQMHRDGLTVANSGNISLRYNDHVLITPSGVTYESLKPDDIVMLDLNGHKLAGEFKPSSEWHFHCGLYRHRPDARAVVHAHSPYATALSCTRQALPPFHYMLALFGSDHVPCASYATFGTEALSSNILAAIGELKACLLANHGMITVGKDIQQAYRHALELESLCQQYQLACSLGEVKLLEPHEIQEAFDQFQSYGQEKT